MKMTINEDQRGFLFRNGRFVRMLEPGGHFAPSFLGYKVVVELVDDKPLGDGGLLAAYGRDEKFLKSTARVEIGDGQKALHCVDGRFAEILPRGVYVYWNIFKHHSFIILNTSDEDPAGDIPESVLRSISDPYCKRIYIKDTQRGFLFKNECFVRMLTQGLNIVPAFLHYSSKVTNVSDEADESSIDEIELAMFSKDENFLKSVGKVDVTDGQIALHYVDGRYSGVLRKGTHAFWNVFKRHTFRIIDMQDDSTAADIPPFVLEDLPDDICARVKAEDWSAVMLYINGEFVRRLPAGTHYFWRNGRDISWTTYDMRTTQLDVSGQEILTSDKVALRVNFVCSYRIADPLAIGVKVKDHSTQLYAAVQLALRGMLGGMRFDEVLEAKDVIASRVLTLLKQRESELFVEFLSAGMKDIILPGEVRDIMNTVLIAEKRAQANVITRREEVASTRSLLNTAKLMDENATLYKLKELEYLERICDKVESIKVENVSGLLGQLGSMIKV
jgi:regulator of protease activity HflC (stomatin/prohibitin superfamily)